MEYAIKTILGLIISYCFYTLIKIDKKVSILCYRVKKLEEKISGHEGEEI